MKFSPFLAVFLIHLAMVIGAPVFLILVGPAWTIVPRGESLSIWVGTLHYLDVAAGLALAGSGAVFYVGTVRGLTIPGKGTPAIWDPPRFLVRGGIYRIVRNPMYVAVICVAAGEALVLNRALLAVYAAALWFGFHLFVTLYEEPDLIRRFGASYRDYCRSVPRWLPRLSR